MVIETSRKLAAMTEKDNYKLIKNVVDYLGGPEVFHKSVEPLVRMAKIKGQDLYTTEGLTTPILMVIVDLYVSGKIIFRDKK